MDDEIDIELRGATEIARRAVVVSAVLQRVALDEASDRNDLDLDGEAYDLREWITAESLRDALTPIEVRVFETPVGEIPREHRLDLSWQSEALATLLWSLAKRELTAPGHQSHLVSLIDTVPHPWDRVSAWADQAHLRPESEIARERELAEIWYWRLGAEIGRRSAPESERPAYAQAVGEVVAEAAAAGYFVDAKRTDFVVSGRLVQDLGPEELNRLAAMAEERLRSLNWVSGFGASWDEVPLEV